MSTLTNEDFRKLLATPRRDGENTEQQKTFSKLSKEEKLKSLKNEIRKEDNRKKQKHQSKNQKYQNKEKKQEKVPKYRDRAKERREGKNNFEELLFPSKDDTSVFADRSEMDEKEVTLQKIAALQYFDGGLAQTSKPQVQEPEEKPEMKGLNNLEMRDNTNTGRGKRLGQQIWESVMNTRTKKPNQGTDIFTFGRAAYVFNLAAPMGDDIPTILLRSKEESSHFKQEKLYKTSDNLTKSIIHVTESMKRNREQVRKLQVVVENQPVVAKPIPQPQPQPTEDQFSDMEEDIFSDAEEYKPPVKSTKEAPVATAKEAPKSYFKSKAQPIDFEVKVDLSAYLSTEQQKKMEKYSNVNFNEISDKKLEQRKKLENTKENFYEECYFGGEGSSYAPVIHESDSEEDDLARMERKKKEIQKMTGEDTQPGEGRKNNKRKPVRKNKTAKKPKVT